MLTKIGFKNYKLFKHYNELEIKPITILFGKNSSGKSSITKFLHVFLETFEGTEKEMEYMHFALEQNEVEIGAEFRDLVYGRRPTGTFELFLDYKEYNYNNKYNIIFGNSDQRGFKPIVLSQSHEITRFYGQDTFYLGPIRSEAERYYSPVSNIKYLRNHPKGNDSYERLIFEALDTESNFLQNLNTWFKSVFDGWSIKINSDRDPYQIEVSKDTLSINLKDTGQGICQFIPIAVQCFTETEKNTLCILEQPELHLHPAAHGDIAELFVNSALKDKNKRFVIETHSQNLILRIRKLIADGTISNEDVSLNFIDFDEEQTISTIRKINIDSIGKVDYWPEGIFEEAYHEAKELFQAQKEKLKNEVRN